MINALAAVVKNISNATVKKRRNNTELLFMFTKPILQHVQIGFVLNKGT
jgi:hypothetical protein